MHDPKSVLMWGARNGYVEIIRVLHGRRKISYQVVV
jgi:plasmid stabilization system protein ParE